MSIISQLLCFTLFKISCPLAKPNYPIKQILKKNLQVCLKDAVSNFESFTISITTQNFNLLGLTKMSIP